MGSTGSIGRNTIEVVDACGGRLNLAAISAHSNLAEAVRQARRLNPKWIVATDQQEAEAFDWSQLPPHTRLLTGADALATVAAADEIDIVVSAIVGLAGLRGTWAALEAGKRVALANKETLVIAGPLVMRLARQCGAEVLPIDSEHSAIFQALAAGRAAEVRRVILTASGGPFRHCTPKPWRPSPQTTPWPTRRGTWVPKSPWTRQP